MFHIKSSLYEFQWFTHNLGNDTNFQDVATNTCALLKTASLTRQHGNGKTGFLKSMGRVQYPSTKASMFMRLSTIEPFHPLSCDYRTEGCTSAFGGSSGMKPSKSFWSSFALTPKQCRWPKSWFIPSVESLCVWPLETHAHTGRSPLSKYMRILQIFPTQSCPCP